MDADPVPNEFTEGDLISVRPENEITYSILCTLNDTNDDPNGAPAIGFTKADIDRLNEIHDLISDPNEPGQDSFLVAQRYRDDILRLWQEGQKGIAVIHRLSKYDEIADLSKPDLEVYFIAAADLKYLTKLTHCYVLSEIAEGRNEAVQELIMIDGLARKLSVTARSMVAKLVCYAMFSGDFKTASLICSYPDCSGEMLAILMTHFKPLGEKQLSRKNSLVFECFWFKNAIEKIKETDKLDIVIKTNSSLRYNQSYIQQLICIEEGQTHGECSPISVWPWNSPNWPRVYLDTRNNWCYSLYNRAGFMMTQHLMPAHAKIQSIKMRIQIEDDLFQWILARRMGQEGSLKARAYSEEYTVDLEKEIVFSVGPDGELYTDDDIKMRINPEVLGLK